MVGRGGRFLAAAVRGVRGNEKPAKGKELKGKQSQINMSTNRMSTPGPKIDRSTAVKSFVLVITCVKRAYSQRKGRQRDERGDRVVFHPRHIFS